MLLDDVKIALGSNDDDTATNIMINSKITAVRELADLPDSVMDTELGNALIVIGVTDIWNLQAGEIKFSPAYDIIWNKLYNKSLEGETS